MEGSRRTGQTGLITEVEGTDRVGDFARTIVAEAAVDSRFEECADLCWYCLSTAGCDPVTHARVVVQDASPAPLGGFSCHYGNLQEAEIYGEDYGG